MKFNSSTSPLPTPPIARTRFTTEDRKEEAKPGVKVPRSSKSATPQQEEAQVQNEVQPPRQRVSPYMDMFTIVTNARLEYNMAETPRQQAFALRVVRLARDEVSNNHEIRRRDRDYLIKQVNNFLNLVDPLPPKRKKKHRKSYYTYYSDDEPRKQDTKQDDCKREYKDGYRVGTTHGYDGDNYMQGDTECYNKGYEEGYSWGEWQKQEEEGEAEDDVGSTFTDGPALSDEEDDEAANSEDNEETD